MNFLISHIFTSASDQTLQITTYLPNHHIVPPPINSTSPLSWPSAAAAAEAQYQNLLLQLLDSNPQLPTGGPGLRHVQANLHKEIRCVERRFEDREEFSNLVFTLLHGKT